MLPYLRNDGQRSQKYTLEEFYLLSQVNALLPPHQGHSMIWNRFHKVSINRPNIPLDLMPEYYNNTMKNIVRVLGRNSTNRNAVDRYPIALTVIETLIQTYDSEYKVFKRSGKHYENSQEKDLKKIVHNLMVQNALSLQKRSDTKDSQELNQIYFRIKITVNSATFS